MAKFEKKITELGLEEGKLSKNLNKFVRDYRKAEAQLEEMKDELKTAPDEKKEELQNEITELEEALAETDEELVGRVQTYADNREYYAQKVQDLNRGRQKAEQARGAASNPQPQPEPEPQKAEEAPKQEETPKIEEAKVVSTEPAGTAAAKAVPIEEKKKDSSNWLLWGVLGIAGIMVGVNLFRNKN